MSIPCQSLLAALTLSFAALTLPVAAYAQEEPVIERVDSPDATVTQVVVEIIPGAVQVRGYLRKRPAGRGPIPGHLHIEVLGAGDVLLGTERLSYHRIHRRDKEWHFAETVAVSSTGLVERVRIIHHGVEDMSCPG